MMRCICEQAHRLFLLDYMRKEIETSKRKILILHSAGWPNLTSRDQAENLEAEQERLDEFEKEYDRLKSAKF